MKSGVLIRDDQAHLLAKKKPKVIYHKSFEDKDDVILAPMPRSEEFARRLGENPTLDEEQEHHLFRQMHYMWWRAEKDNAHHWLKEAEAVRQQIIHANLRLASKVAKRVARTYGKRHDDLIGDANYFMMLAVDRFNYNMGTKFSTYATWVLLRRFNRMLKQDNHVTGYDNDFFDDQPDTFSNNDERTEQIRDYLDRLLKYVDRRRRRVLMDLHGLNGVWYNNVTLGERMGISDERVRQLKTEALDQVREKASNEEFYLA